MKIEKKFNKIFWKFQSTRKYQSRYCWRWIISSFRTFRKWKNNTLRMIAGLETVDSIDKGRFYFNNIDVAKKKKIGDIGFVFQHYALFRHMTVFENIAFGLRVKPKNKDLATKR